MNNTTTQILDPSTVLIPAVASKSANEASFVLFQHGGMAIINYASDADGSNNIEEQFLSPDQVRAMRNFLNSQISRDTLHIK